MEARQHRSFMALVASVLLHAAIAVLAGLHAARASRTIARQDVWTGDTIDVTALVSAPARETSASLATQGPAAVEAREPERASPPAPSPAAPTPPSSTATAVAKAATPPRASEEASSSADDWLRVEDQRDAPPPATTANPEPADGHAALVRKILEFRPKVPSSPPPDEGATEPAAAAAAPAASALGAAGPSGPPRNLEKAFTRAIPAANSQDPAWSRLPLGDAGSIRVRIVVGEDGTVSDTRVLDEQPPAHLTRLVERTVLALRGGRFVLSGATSGALALRIEVTLSKRPVAEGPLELGFESPRPGRPGRAYFQLATGRFVEARVNLE